MKNFRFNLKAFLCCFVILLTGFLLISCNKPVPKNNIPSYKSLETEIIISLIQKTLPTNTITPSMRFSDQEYLLPVESWITSDFRTFFKQFLFDYQVSTYKTQRNDCDDLALYGRAAANILNRHGNQTSTGIAVGEFKYLSGISGHVVNCIVVSDNNGSIKILYFEPQTMEIFALEQENLVPLSYTF